MASFCYYPACLYRLSVRVAVEMPVFSYAKPVAQYSRSDSRRTHFVDALSLLAIHPSMDGKKACFVYEVCQILYFYVPVCNFAYPVQFCCHSCSAPVWNNISLHSAVVATPFPPSAFTDFYSTMRWSDSLLGFWLAHLYWICFSILPMADPSGSQLFS